MSKIIIRKETKADYRQTELMTMRAFWNIHGPGCTEHYLVHILRESDCYIPELSRVAELDGKIVGAIMYSKAQIYDGDTIHEVLTFGPLCVEPTAHNHGIGGKLLRETIQLAKDAGYPGICIFGEPDYYPKHGFKTCDHFGITDWEGNNYGPFMGYELLEGAFSQIHGRFKEDDVFEKCNDIKMVDKFNENFPEYPMLKLSCQWLHKEKLGRICEVQRNSYTIKFWEEELPAKLCGAFYNDDLEFPVVGDYVTFEYNPYGDCPILTVCERKTILKRPDQSGHSIGYVKTIKEQPMIANFDYVFIVSSLNKNYNVNRIARYMTITLQSGAVPVVILTKSDLCDNVSEYIDEITALSDKVKVHTVCSLNGNGLDDIKGYLNCGTTIALLGSSGVGKSTLLNALAGKDIMKTGGIQEKSSKGKHTTTYRQLIVLDNGVTIIDTPGMRELGMCDVEEGIEDTFSDISDLECQCKFSDCRHQSEPGCAIKQALSDGSLSPERFNLYLSLQNESKKTADMKAISKAIKNMKKYKR